MNPIIENLRTAYKGHVYAEDAVKELRKTTNKTVILIEVAREIEVIAQQLVDGVIREGREPEELGPEIAFYTYLGTIEDVLSNERYTHEQMKMFESEPEDVSHHICTNLLRQAYTTANVIHKLRRV